MAASLHVRGFISVLSRPKLPQVQPVRLKSNPLIPRRKKPIQKWFDPKDNSWAEPILKQQREKESQPEKEPSLLHMVYRIKDHYSRPYWEKDVLKEFDLFEKPYTPVVLKNTPEINEKLHKIKHLIRIKPVTFPYGLPKDERDYKHCFLRETGEFVVKHGIYDQGDEIEQAWAEVKLTEEQSPKEDIWKMDKDTLEKESRRILQRFRLSEEYFEVQYNYKYNQDGKEARYKGEEGINRFRQKWY